MTSLFISDLHLEEKRPDITRAFLHFLQQKASTAAELYILGDLFEAWVGDDDDSELAAQIKPALAQLTANGTALYFIHGNRDFLIGKDFAAQTGCQLLDDPCLIDLYGVPTVILHGDSLCTRDSEYQQLRTLVRSSQWQREVLEKPLDERRQLARQLRMASKDAGSNKAEDIMDVTPEEVASCLRHYRCQRMIHGHTHRPAVHTFDIDGQAAERIVLGDWDSHWWTLTVDEQGYQLEKGTI